MSVYPWLSQSLGIWELGFEHCYEIMNMDRLSIDESLGPPTDLRRNRSDELPELASVHSAPPAVAIPIDDDESAASVASHNRAAFSATASSTG